MRFTTVAASLFALFSVASAGPIQRRQAEGTVLSSPVENGTYYKFSEWVPTLIFLLPRELPILTSET